MTLTLCTPGAMGPEEDPMAVLDSHARVRGVNGLRVVDASAFPLCPPGHPQSTVCQYPFPFSYLLLTASRFTRLTSSRYGSGEDCGLRSGGRVSYRVERTRENPFDFGHLDRKL